MGYFWNLRLTTLVGGFSKLLGVIDGGRPRRGDSLFSNRSLVRREMYMKLSTCDDKVSTVYLQTAHKLWIVNGFCKIRPQFLASFSLVNQGEH